MLLKNFIIEAFHPHLLNNKLQALNSKQIQNSKFLNSKLF